MDERPRRIVCVAIGILVACGVVIPSGRASGAEARIPARPEARDSVDGSDAFVSADMVLLLASGAAATALAFHVEDAASMARRLEGSPFEIASDVGNTYGDGRLLGGAALGLSIGGRAVGSPGAVRLGDGLTRSLLATSVAVWTLKSATHRTRPDGGPRSFPSGHTAAAFCVVPVLQKEFGWKVGLPAVLLATSTAVGRMEDRRHFASDVVFGATIGLIAGTVFSRNAGPSPLVRHLSWSRDGLGVRFNF